MGKNGSKTGTKISQKLKSTNIKKFDTVGKSIKNVTTNADKSIYLKINLSKVIRC